MAGQSVTPPFWGARPFGPMDGRCEPSDMAISTGPQSLSSSRLALNSFIPQTNPPELPYPPPLPGSSCLFVDRILPAPSSHPPPSRPPAPPCFPPPYLPPSVEVRYRYPSGLRLLQTVSPPKKKHAVMSWQGWSAASRPRLVTRIRAGGRQETPLLTVARPIAYIDTR